jgi:hypothetical protein
VYIEPSRRIPWEGDMATVTGTKRATAIEASNPGNAPKSTPTSVPNARTRRFSGCRAKAYPVKISDHISFSSIKEAAKIKEHSFTSWKWKA